MLALSLVHESFFFPLTTIVLTILLLRSAHSKDNVSLITEEKLPDFQNGLNWLKPAIREQTDSTFPRVLCGSLQQPDFKIARPKGN